MTSIDQRVDEDPVTALAAEFFLEILWWRVGAGRVGVPVLTTVDAPTMARGFCISCGIVTPAGWRCPLCRVAVGIALEALDLAGIDQQETGPEASVSKPTTATMVMAVEESMQDRREPWRTTR